jgi:hypothetical protein
MSRFSDLFQEQPAPAPSPEPAPEPVKLEKVVPTTKKTTKKKGFTMD